MSVRYVDDKMIKDVLGKILNGCRVPEDDSWTRETAEQKSFTGTYSNTYASIARECGIDSDTADLIITALYESNVLNWSLNPTTARRIRVSRREAKLYWDLTTFTVSFQEWARQKLVSCNPRPVFDKIWTWMTKNSISGGIGIN